MTYRALDAAAERIAGWLGAQGILPGQVVALKGHPDPQVLSALHGIWRAGAAVFPMNPSWTPSEEDRALGRVTPELLLLGKGMAGVVDGPKTLGLEEDSSVWTGSLNSAVPDPGALLLEPEATGDSLDRMAAFLLTSGTSGEARVVGLTVGNLLASADGARERLDLLPSDCWLASLSLAHVGGLALTSRAAVLGASLFLGGRFQAEPLVGLIREGRITHASLVPTMLAKFLDVWGNGPVPPSLRCLLIGGAAADPHLVRRATSVGFPLALTYGLTEASSQVATAPPELVSKHPKTVGPPLPGVQVRIGKRGEILVRGPTVAPGQRGADGWLRTGDLGVLEKNGHLSVTGRLSDRIISGGVNVDPVEVEAVLRAHPGVLEVAVVGIPDSTWGERVAAALVLDSEGGTQVGEVESLSRDTLSPAKRPREFLVVPSLPQNPNGKLDRSGVRSLFV